MNKLKKIFVSTLSFTLIFALSINVFSDPGLSDNASAPGHGGGGGQTGSNPNAASYLGWYAYDGGDRINLHLSCEAEGVFVYGDGTANSSDNFACDYGSM